MSCVIIIPARFGSTRFPGKPLATIHEKSVLHRTWSIAKKVSHITGVYIATDHVEIKNHAIAFGAKVIMTDSHCENGTERVFAAIQTLSFQPEFIINLQGDAVLTPPWVIQALVDQARKTPELQLGTIATQLDLTQYQAMQAIKTQGEVGGTLVVFDKNYRALYFSKNMIPFVRNFSATSLPLYRHIGLYLYRYQTLATYLQLPPTPLEKTEGLEQLRALEHGIPIHVVPVDYRGRTHASVDSPADIQRIEALLKQEGEII